MSPPDLPPLDCHAHIAPDVTPSQVAGLDGALVFAMTRTPQEAQAAASRSDATLAWGFGAHPGLPDAMASVNARTLSMAAREHAVIGEVGLDRRGPAAPQLAVLEAVLEACHGQPVLISLHSTGRTAELLDMLRRRPHPGAILHWFNGTADEIAAAVELGCYFSVNHAMTDERLALMPYERVLPETDFPASRRTTQARKPGDTAALEKRLAALAGTTTGEIRLAWYLNLGRLADAARAAPRLGAGFRAAIAAARIR